MLKKQDLVVGYMVRFKMFGRIFEGQVKKLEDKIAFIQVPEGDGETPVYYEQILDVV